MSNVILRVSDLEASITFWRDAVGLELEGATGEFAFLSAGEARLVLNRRDGVPADQTETEIVFEVEDVHDAYREMADRGVPFQVEPRAVTEAGGRSLLAAHFADPDGHLASISGWVAD